MTRCEQSRPASVRAGKRLAFWRLGACVVALSGCGGIEFTAGGGPGGQTGPRGPGTAQLVTWNGALSAEALGQTPGPSVQGKSLYAIVSSQVSGRPDGLLCSNCHFKGSGRPYSPDVGKDGSAPISPETVVSGATWSAQGGWVDQFTALATKPGVLKLPFDTWKKEGAK